MPDFVKIRHPDLPTEWTCTACGGGPEKPRCYRCMGSGIERRQPSEVPSEALAEWVRIGWQVVEADVVDDRPAASAGKPEWVAYAEELGVDTTGMTKTAIIEAVDDTTVQE